MTNDLTFDTLMKDVKPASRHQIKDDCPYSRRRIKGKCSLLECTNDLPKGRRSWCSDECSLKYLQNHFWSYARHAALKRDRYRCTKCGQSDRELLKAALLLQDRSQMEVDHIVPTAPGNYGAGCHNHLTNLRVLCHTHHNERTQKYRQELRKSRNNATT